MKDKAQLILDTAHSLFLENGYRNTSIQKIAESAGIAKGSVYMYYDSKADIVLAILKRFDEEIIKKVDELSARKDIDARERFLYKLMLVLDYGDEQQRLQSVIQEAVLQINERLYDYVREAQARWSRVQYDALLDYFGKEILPWSADISIIINGITDAFTYYIKIEHYIFDLGQLADTILFAADSYAKALMASQRKPVIDAETFFGSGKEDSRTTAEKPDPKGLLLEELCAAITSVERSEHTDKDFILISFERIRSQMNDKNPDLFLLRSLLAGLRPFPEHAALRSDLADFYQIADY